MWIETTLVNYCFYKHKRIAMEEKHNNATKRRPEGARPLDAGIIPINIPKYIDQLKGEDAYQKNGKNAITVFKSDTVTITLIAMKIDAEFEWDHFL